MGELFHVLVRKAKRRPARARAAVLGWRDAYPFAETSDSVMVSAMDLASTHGLSIWDSVVLAASAEAECRLWLSEDLREGFTWRGLTVANPFRPAMHPLLAALLKTARRVTPARLPRLADLVHVDAVFHGPVLHVNHFQRLPAFHRELVGDHARAGLHPFQTGL